jgi:hypothetical protein
MASRTQLRSFEVKKCPRCGGQHHFALAVRPVPEGVAIFGGPGAQEVAFICPKTRTAFTEQIMPEPNTEILGPADPSQLATYAPEASVPNASAADAAMEEFQAWQQSSRSIAIDFCKTMLTVATGAIPVFFAVLQYLGVEHATGSFWQRAAILPPVLFLASAATFVLALRPAYAIITQSDFAAYRQYRLRRMNTFILVATATFMLGVAIATVNFFAILFLSP